MASKKSKRSPNLQLLATKGLIVTNSWKGQTEILTLLKRLKSRPILATGTTGLVFESVHLNSSLKDIEKPKANELLSIEKMVNGLRKEPEEPKSLAISD